MCRLSGCSDCLSVDVLLFYTKICLIPFHGVMMYVLSISFCVEGDMTLFWGVACYLFNYGNGFVNLGSHQFDCDCGGANMQIPSTFIAIYNFVPQQFDQFNRKFHCSFAVELCS